jgi:hypothetical protein
MVPPKLAADLNHDFRLRFVNDLLDHAKIEHVLPGLDTGVVHLFRYDTRLILFDPFAQRHVERAIQWSRREVVIHRD